MNYNPFPFEKKITKIEKVAIIASCLILAHIIVGMIYAEQWGVLLCVIAITIILGFILYFLTNKLHKEINKLKVGDDINYNMNGHHPRIKGKIVEITKHGAVIEFELTEIPLVSISLLEEKRK